MSEKRHKINKLANKQNITVRNSPAFDHHVFVPSQNPLIFGLWRDAHDHYTINLLTRPLMITLQVVRISIAFKRMYGK